MASTVSFHSDSFIARINTIFPFMVDWKRDRKVNNSSLGEILRTKMNLISWCIILQLPLGYRTCSGGVSWKRSSSFLDRRKRFTKCFICYFFVLFLWKVVNSLFDKWTRLFFYYATTQVKSTVDENKAKCYILYFLGQEQLELQDKKAFYRPFKKVDITFNCSRVFSVLTLIY